jgi:hypothetical protein
MAYEPSKCLFFCVEQTAVQATEIPPRRNTTITWLADRQGDRINLKVLPSL